MNPPSTTTVHRNALIPALVLTLILLLAMLAPASANGPDGLKEAPSDSGAAPSDMPGLTGEGTYTSPQFGLDITWEPSWVVGDVDHPAVQHAIGGYWSNAVDSVDDVGDIVFLMDTASESAVLSLAFSYLSPNISVSDVLAYMHEPEYLTHNLFISEDAEVLLVDASSTSVAILALDGDHLAYQLLVVDPGDEDFGFWIGLDIYGLDIAEDILRSVERDVWVEANDIFGVFEVNDMIAAIPDPAPAVGITPLGPDLVSARRTP